MERDAQAAAWSGLPVFDQMIVLCILS